MSLGLWRVSLLGRSVTNDFHCHGCIQKDTLKWVFLKVPKI